MEKKVPVVIYSMWKGYLEQESTKEFLKGYKRYDLHTSGHADSGAIKLVIDTVMPDKVIPMHTEVPQAFLELSVSGSVVLAEDGEVIEIQG